MKFYVDDVMVFELSENDKKVLMSEINEDEFVEDMKRRVAWVISSKLANVQTSLQKEWLPILSKTMKYIPTDKNELSELIINHPDYKDRKNKDFQEKK